MVTIEGVVSFLLVYVIRLGSRLRCGSASMVANHDCRWIRVLHEGGARIANLSWVGLSSFRSPIHLSLSTTGYHYYFPSIDLNKCCRCNAAAHFVIVSSILIIKEVYDCLRVKFDTVIFKYRSYD